MTVPAYQDDGPSPRRFYRDRENAVFLGVCSGIADYFGFKLWATRVLAILSLFLFMPAALLIYFGLGLLTPKKPLALYRDEREEEFWRGVRVSPRATFSETRHKFRELDVRLQRLERYVTSPRFNLDQEFRDLEND